jgi:3-oxoacid CoA-transferase
MHKIADSAAAAVHDIEDGATLAIGGFGPLQGWPVSLVSALRDKGSRDLTIVFNTPGVGPTTPQMLAETKQIKKVIASYAIYPTRRTPLEDGIRAGEIEVELVPQGTLVERLRAAGAGLAAFYTPTGVGTEISAGKEVREFDGRSHVLETALRVDFALVRAARADRHGNLVYRRGSRNFNPAFATAGRTTIAEVDEIVDSGGLDPESVVTPGIYVDRIVRDEQSLDAKSLLEISRLYGKHQRLEARSAPGVPSGLTPELMAYKAATQLRDGEYVNLGLGVPTLVSNFITPDRNIQLHAENGILGYGPLAQEGDEDLHLYNASGQLVSTLPGCSFFDSTDAFAMARGGRLTTVVLGGYQVAENGDLANWNVPGSGAGGIGGAMDLASGGARVIAVLFHTDREGRPKLVRRCTYPLTAAACVDRVVTDLALLAIDERGFVVLEIAPGLTLGDLEPITDAPLYAAPDIREMT